MPAVPVGTTTQNPGLLHQQGVIFYSKVGLDRLEPQLRFLQVGKEIPMPRNSGKTIQLFRFNLPGANTIPAAEGVNPNPVPQSSYIITATLEQYSDYMDSSTLYDETNIDSRSSAKQMVSDLSFRAAISADTVARNEIDSNTAYTLPTLGANFTVQDIKYNVAMMEGANVRPYANGKYMCIVHPFVMFDLRSDNTAGGFIDSMKYTNGTKVLNGEIGEAGGARIVTTTNVNQQGSAPGTLYSTYLFGDGAFAFVPLAGSGPTKITDPNRQNFKVYVSNPAAGVDNPTREVGTLAYYRFVMATKLTDPQRMRIILCDASAI